MARKYQGDTVKPGCGIDGTLGETFSKRSQDPWTQKANHPENPSYTGKYTSNESGLRQSRYTAPNFSDSDTYSIDSDVERNLGPSGAIKGRGE